MVSIVSWFTALAAAWVLAAGPVAAQDVPAVPTLVVGAGHQAQVAEFEGVLEPQQQSVLAAQTSGRLLALTVQAGDRVRAGQVLARIDERGLAAGLAAGDAAVAQARAGLAQARQQLDRTAALRVQGFVADAALDAARSQADAAQAALAAAEAGRQQAAVNRGFAVVTAPFDGLVLATQAEAGELAVPGRALVTVYTPGRLRARVWLPLGQTAAARSAATVELLLPDGRVVRPLKHSLLPGADAASQTVEWRLDLPPEAVAGLLPGQPVRVRFAAAPAAAAAAQAMPQATFSIPAAALLRRGELTAVYAEQGGRFVLKAVRAGRPAGNQVPVLAGLKPGERIAADAVRAGLAGAVPAR